MTAARVRAAALGVCAALLLVLVYVPSFKGAFVFDDLASIVHNPTIRSLAPLTGPLAPPHDGSPVQGRPLLNLSFAVNHALGGLDPWGWHAVNLAIHALAAFVLFALVRRVLRAPPLAARFGASAGPLAFAIALLWAVHPLQTESVTYVSQRAESLMGLFYLVTVYAVLRAAEPDGRSAARAAAWGTVAVVACLLGVATKEVAATAPLVALLFDRTLCAGSFGAALRRRGALYAGLAATWVPLAWLVFGAGTRSGTAGAVPGVSARSYALTQPGVVLHYLRLVVWPHPLVLDYGWPLAPSLVGALPALVVLLALCGATLYGVVRGAAWSLAPAWLLLILAPTSSVVPIKDAAFEHRMYLPLAAPLALLVLGVYLLLQRLAHERGLGAPRAAGAGAARTLGGSRAAVAGAALTLGAAAALGAVTYARNGDYRSELTIWRETAARRPDNARAAMGLGNALLDLGATDEALLAFDRAIALAANTATGPDRARHFFNRANALARLGRTAEALAEFDQALANDPAFAEAYNNRGAAHMAAGDMERALRDFERAIGARPGYADAYSNRGTARARGGDLRGALADFDEALRLDPASAAAWGNRGAVRLALGACAEARGDLEAALRIDPALALARTTMDELSRRCGRNH